MLSGSIGSKEIDTKKIFRLIPNEPGAKDLISRCLSQFPENRPSVETIMTHKFFKGIDWDEVRDLQLENYFIPVVLNKYDTKYFTYE